MLICLCLLQGAATLSGSRLALIQHTLLHYTLRVSQNWTNNNGDVSRIRYLGPYLCTPIFLLPSLFAQHFCAFQYNTFRTAIHTLHPVQLSSALCHEPESTGQPHPPHMAPSGHTGSSVYKCCCQCVLQRPKIFWLCNYLEFKTRNKNVIFFPHFFREKKLYLRPWPLNKISIHKVWLEACQVKSWPGKHHEVYCSALQFMVVLCKLDGVGPVDNRPSTN